VVVDEFVFWPATVRVVTVRRKISGKVLFIPILLVV
jgi:hypothetical protein